ncbi:3-carboxy-cis,cis-mucoante lactonizing enzyme [Glarea lozoyensis ATCC 20868]|uniref:3-carboxy-cis,cis-mucoante lactonizing enzyme n=1 Tax=Glarea lozoyensis (strain ATCC 20868 / MF5171) TaxID=1116229 RepID=S3D264_GLAL2|nr:3-carboxy-cis,cis-mucoante lactonizing enzyme [Glarea lozoyensis ATCC 20868]EPE31900.1 3-carboxy-cis,cis-mucoante lactonizing enzyme [Glarea lozoyensis ATCC 20868]
MYSLTTLLTTLSLLSATLAAPLTIPLGSTGLTITISSDGGAQMNNGQKVDLSPVMAMMSQASPAECATPPAQGNAKAGNAKAVYFLTNAANNAVVALKVGADGKLSAGSMTSTQGKGGVGVDAAGKPALPDGTFSQSIIRVEGSTMIALNPGSNTASLFSISSRDATKLTMIGSPVDTMGDFPVSVAVSSKLSMACVANTGARAGIACYKITPTGLLPSGSLRPFALNQTNPPSGPLNTVSQTFFNGDSTALLTTVKGDPTKKNTGFLSSFPVTAGMVSMTGTQTSPNGTAVLFGSTVLPGTSDIFVTDASFGTATLSSSTGFAAAAVSASTKLDGQKATCWATFSAVTSTAFVTDVARNVLSEIDTKTGEVVKSLDAKNGNIGLIDLASKGNFVYALAPGNATAGVPVHVAVYDVSGGRGSVKEVQNFEVMGVSDSVQGMTLC